MRRILVHAGFHKTGTSTVQNALRALPLEPQGPKAVQGRSLAGWRIALEEDFPDVAASARAYSVSQDPLELGLFRAYLADWAEALALGSDENLFLSCESLAGEIPGRPGRARDYRQGAVLLPALVGVLQLVFGPDLQFQVFLSTRAPGPWLESLHWQLSRSVGMCDYAAPFMARMQPAADLAGQAREIARALAPHPLSVSAVEDTHSHPEGPLAPLFDLMQLSATARAPFAHPVRMNSRPGSVDTVALANKFVDINRRALPPDETRALKQNLLNQIRAQARRTRAPDMPNRPQNPAANAATNAATRPAAKDNE